MITCSHHGHFGYLAEILNFGFPNFYEKLCEILDTEIEEPDDDYVESEDIYPYTQNVGMLMVYIPLGGIVALATVVKVRRYRTGKKIEKIEKIRKKYTNI